jgi:hypothetical protein
MADADLLIRERRRNSGRIPPRKQQGQSRRANLPLRILQKRFDLFFVPGYSDCFDDAKPVHPDLGILVAEQLHDLCGSDSGLEPAGQSDGAQANLIVRVAQQLDVIDPIHLLHQRQHSRGRLFQK